MCRQVKRSADRAIRVEPLDSTRIPGFCFADQVLPARFDVELARPLVAALWLVGAIVIQATCLNATSLGAGAATHSATPAELDDEALPSGAIVRLGTLRMRHDRPGVQAAAFSPDGTLVASCGDHNEVRVWRTDNGAEFARLPIPRHPLERRAPPVVKMSRKGRETGQV